MNEFNIIGIALGILLAFVSLGRLYLPLMESFVTSTQEYTRVGKRRLKLVEFEEALIALAGPLANVLLLFVLQVMNASGIFDRLILMSALYATVHMIPVSSLDGGKIFFSSPTLWVLGSVFILLSAALIALLNVFPPLLLLVLFSLIAAGVFFYYKVYSP